MKRKPKQQETGREKIGNKSLAKQVKKYGSRCEGERAEAWESYVRARKAAQATIKELRNGTSRQEQEE